jgi:ribonuclease R
MSALPSKTALLDWIRDQPAEVSRRDIARAFGIKGGDRPALKALLRELAEEGHLEKDRRNWRGAGRLPPVGVLEVIGTDADGDLYARPMDWAGEGPAPRALYIPRKGEPALAPGDRILARLAPVGEAGAGHAYEARLIRRIAATGHRLLGLFRADAEGGRVVPVDKGERREWQVRARDTHGAMDGELVEAEPIQGSARLGLPRARILDRLGDPGAPRAVSLIAIHAHGIPDSFPDTVLAAAEAAAPLTDFAGREDLRHIPLVTIDPEDARDHDDAVFAEPDPDPANPGGHILWVAIADVAHYVHPGSPLDREARARGNSTYFPDRVVPMLPEALSADLCSLRAGQDRPVLAVRLVIGADGTLRRHRFARAMIRSAAALSYAQVQAAQDGRPDPDSAAFRDSVIAPLYAAYAALCQARAARAPLDLDLPERRIVLARDGRVTSVAFRERLDAHRLIEEFMILANVAAAETLEARRSPLLYRVHEEPPADKIDALREVAEGAGLALARGQVLRTRQLNRLLDQAAGGPAAEIMNLAVLRSMTQAYYGPENLGHFGLALRAYAHFTSPIRRYADLVVHRALIAAHGWGPDGLSRAEIESLAETAQHISETERRSMAAERDTTDRYLAAYLSDRVGAEFAGRISGIARFGIFVRIAENGADGLVPISELGDEYFHYDRDSQTLMGDRSGLILGLGTPVTVRLTEAVPVTGGLLLELVSVDGRALGRPFGRGAARATPARPPRRGRARRAAQAKGRGAAANRPARQGLSIGHAGLSTHGRLGHVKMIKRLQRRIHLLSGNGPVHPLQGGAVAVRPCGTAGGRRGLSRAALPR